MLALYLQDGLGFTALQSGLTVTPFAIGSALASVTAGRVITRLGRRVTVFGLSLVAVGFVALAVVVPLTSPSHPALWLLVPLFVAGVGGGATISPNITMTLSAVPPRMGGAAGGALQTGQRIGSAIGAAVLTAAFRLDHLLGRLARDGGVRRVPHRAGVHAGRAGDGGAGAADPAHRRHLDARRPRAAARAQLRLGPPLYAGGVPPQVTTWWDRVSAVAPAPDLGLVLLTALLAFAATSAPGTWRHTRHLVTIAHEGAHGVAALAQRPAARGHPAALRHLRADASRSAADRGFGMVVTSAAGYVGPALVGLLAATLLAHGHAVGVLWVLLVLLALLLLQIRNFFGLWAVLLAGTGWWS